jgi:hypothetical protein
MAAILFLVVILGLLLAGRAQALAAEYGSEPLLRFQFWQLALVAFVPLVWAAHVAATAKLVAFAAVAAAFGVSAVRARHAHDADDLDF